MEQMKEDFQIPKAEESNAGEIKTASEEKSQSVSEKLGKERRDDGRSPHSRLKSEILANKRVVKVTKGGRRFSFTVLVLVKDEEKKAVAFAHAGGKEVMVAFRKSLHKAQKKLITYFPTPARTIPRDEEVKYKSITIKL